MEKTLELLKSGWNHVANHEKMTFDEVNALHEAISIISALPSKTECNRKLAEHINFMKDKAQKTKVVNVDEQALYFLNLLWQVQFYRDTLLDILPD
jgi:hypothetical protein